MGSMRMATIASILLILLLIAIWTIFRLADDPEGIAPMVFDGWLFGFLSGYITMLVAVMGRFYRSDSSRERFELLSSATILVLGVVASRLIGSDAFLLAFFTSAVGVMLSNMICLRLYALRNQ